MVNLAVYKIKLNIFSNQKSLSKVWLIKFFFTLAMNKPQKPITNTNDPTTRNINAGSNKTPIDKVLKRVNVSFSIHA